MFYRKNRDSLHNLDEFRNYQRISRATYDPPKFSNSYHSAEGLTGNTILKSFTQRRICFVTIYVCRSASLDIKRTLLVCVKSHKTKNEFMKVALLTSFIILSHLYSRVLGKLPHKTIYRKITLEICPRKNSPLLRNFFFTIHHSLQAK